jgi:hypothetical protein
MTFNPTFSNTDSSGHRTDTDGYGERQSHEINYQTPFLKRREEALKKK